MNCVDKNELFKEDGIYYHSRDVSVHYPDQGYDDCFAVEDGSFWFNHRNRVILTVLGKIGTGETVFDMGGGNGFVSMALQKAGIDTVLIEPGQKGCLNAKLRGVKNIICATLDTSGVRGDCMKAAGIFDVLEHIEDDIAFLKEINGKMATGGKLLITVPAYRFLWSYDDDYTGHFRRYTISSLKKVAAQSGFTYTFSTYMFSLLPLPILISRVLMKSSNGKKPTNEEHRATFLSRIMDVFCRLENILIKKGLRIPFGSTCFAVLEKR